MTTNPCAICAAAVSDAHVCTGCSRRLELALGDVPALVADLETVLAKLTVYADQAQRVTGSSTVDLPWNQRAGTARQLLHNRLRSWVGITYAEHPQPRHLPPDRPSALAGWLLHYPEWMRHQQWAAEAIDNMLDAIHEVRTCLDAPAGRTTDPLGPCPHPACNGEIRAYLPRDPDTMCHADCTAEPLHTWDSTQFLGLGRRILREEVA